MEYVRGLSRRFATACLSVVWLLASPVVSYAQSAYTVQPGTREVVDAGSLNGVGGITVSPGATLLIDFGTTSSLVLPGDLNNSGSIHAISTTGGTNAHIGALNIYNNQNALISSTGINLSLTASQSIVNLGTISSAASLSLSAGSGIINSGVLSAMQNINLAVGAAGLINNGSIKTPDAAINIYALATRNLGVIGGEFISKELNLSAPGDIDLNVGQVSGVVNAEACALHATANTSDMRLGNISLTGDPTFYNTGGDVTIGGNLLLPAQNLAIVASGNIKTTASANISTAASNLNAGSILMVAGANFTSTGPSSVLPPGSGDTSSTLTITGPGAGGIIDLTGGGSNPITGLSTAQTGSNGSAGSITLIAYAASNGSLGTVILPSAATISSGTLNNSIFSTNGNVTVIAGASSGNSIQLGPINSSGNIVNSSLNNGAVYIASATPQMLGNPSGSATATVFTAPTFSGQSSITVNSVAGLSAGNTIWINPLGATAEQAVIGSISGNTLTLNSPLQQNHTGNESVYLPATSLVIPPGAGGAGTPIFNNGGIFAAGTTQAGTINLAGITSGGNVVVSTSQSAGTVNITGSVALTQNPTTQTPAAAYLNTPTILISGQNVNVAGGAVVSSAIPGCLICQDTMNIVTSNLSNAGTLSSNFLSVRNNGGSLAVNNSGTMTGTGINPMVSIVSSSGLQLSGQGTISGPVLSVIELAAADNNPLTITANHTFSSGLGGVLILNGQGALGSVNISNGTTLTVNGGPLVSINTPTLNLGAGSAITATGASSYIFTSGALAASPQDLEVTVSSGSATISTVGGNGIIFHPAAGKSLTIDSPGATLNLNGAPVSYFLDTNISTGTTGSVTTNATVTTSVGTPTTKTNPNGGITGIAFEQYVGPATPAPPNFTLFSAYTYPQTILLLAPLASTGLFQSVATYTQGAVLPAGAPDQTDSYVFLGAAKYSIAAAKQMGLQVSAGAYVQQPASKVVDVPGTNAEINYALGQAQKYGNVLDLVVGNECIVTDGSGSILTSVSNLMQSINYAQNQKASFGVANLPVTTRQTYGVLSGVNSPAPNGPYTVDLLNGCTTCTQYGISGSYAGVNDHVYANVYPYFDTPVTSQLIPGITQSQFTTLVQNDIQADLNGTIAAFSAQSINAHIHVGETGWATASTPAGNAPQASLTYAGWYYPAMQQWSANNKTQNSLNYQIPIVGYFEAYDEPWKYTTTAGQGGEPNFGILTANGVTNTTVGQQYQLTSIVNKFATPPTVSMQAAASPPSGPVTSALPPVTPSNTFLQGQITTNSNVSTTILPTDQNPQTQPESSLQLTTAADLNTSLVELGGTRSLVAPNVDTQINTALGVVSIDAGSAALVMQSENELVILALHDDNADSIRVQVGKDLIVVPVGRQVVLTRKGTETGSAANPDRIARRGTRALQLENAEIEASISEFSLPSALNTLKALKMLQSDDPEQRKLARRLLKTAAAMMVLAKDRTPYSR